MVLDEKKKYFDWLTLMAQQNFFSLSNACRLQQHRLFWLYGTPLQHPIWWLGTATAAELWRKKNKSNKPLRSHSTKFLFCAFKIKLRGLQTWYKHVLNVKNNYNFYKETIFLHILLSKFWSAGVNYIELLCCPNLESFKMLTKETQWL